MCKLKSFLPVSRHTTNGLLTCGGTDNEYFCWRYINGFWEKMHELKHPRLYHSSWDSPKGVILIGGKWSENTSEIVTFSTNATDGFPLKHPTRQGSKQMFKKL